MEFGIALHKLMNTQEYEYMTRITWNNKKKIKLKKPTKRNEYSISTLIIEENNETKTWKPNMEEITTIKDWLVIRKETTKKYKKIFEGDI